MRYCTDRVLRAYPFAIARTVEKTFILRIHGNGLDYFQEVPLRNIRSNPRPPTYAYSRLMLCFRSFQYLPPLTILLSYLHPFTAYPAVEEVQACHGLVQRNHVTTSVKSHEGEVAVAFDLSNLLAVAPKFQVLKPNLIISLLTGPFKCLSPTLIT